MMEPTNQKIKEILQMGEDANGITFMLVASVLKVDITHYTTYDTILGADTFSPLDGNSYKEFSINLLLKPGHYDMLSKMEEI